jgi:hypothetical protein
MYCPKIVKSFSSNEYAIRKNQEWLKGRTPKYNEDVDENVEPFLEWGLSVEGALCCRACFSYCNYPDWVEYESCCFSISLLEMKKIVKEFGLLSVFV